jgi:hypothetical protein
VFPCRALHMGPLMKATRNRRVHTIQQHQLNGNGSESPKSHGVPAMFVVDVTWQRVSKGAVEIGKLT